MKTYICHSPHKGTAVFQTGMHYQKFTVDLGAGLKARIEKRDTKGVRLRLNGDRFTTVKLAHVVFSRHWKEV